MSETDIEVHPAAAVFPMLSDDELADLAEDIKTNGLLHPIVLGVDGMLIDGRNRLAACKLAGVDPTFTALNGHDPVAFIISANVHRRHLSKGQQAMAVVMASGLSQTSVRAAAEHLDVSHSRIVYANVVLEYAPDLVENVVSAATTLDVAYAEARRRKDAASSIEAQMEALRAEAPDFANLVAEERMTLREALDLRDKRRADARRRREAATTGLLSAVRFLAPPAGDITEHAEVLVSRLDFTLVPGADAITPVAIARAIAFLETVSYRLPMLEADDGRT